MAAEKHPKQLTDYPYGLDSLARELGNLSYDQLAIFLKELNQELLQQAEADKNRGRKLLAKELLRASCNVGKACENINVAWKICEPFMKNPS